MKTVFILGAGASKQAGAPLMNDFLDRAYDLYRTKNQGISNCREKFEDVFNAIAELKGVYAKAYIDLDNLEVIFGAVEMANLLRQLGTRTPDEIAKLRDSLITVIYKTLEQTISFPIAAGPKITPPQPFPGLISLIKEIREKAPGQDPHQMSFITFNYDLCLDYALYFNSLNYDYCLAETASNHIPLLKLHGSINWGLSDEDEIVPFNFGEMSIDPYAYDGSFKYEVGSYLHQKKHKGKSLIGPPVIVPPTWNKTAYHGNLTKVWSKASRELALANNIVIIGYSLPETDSFFRYLYALGTDSHTRLQNFILINPDPDGTVEKRFRAMIGKGIEPRIRVLNDTFKTAIPKLHQYLVGT